MTEQVESLTVLFADISSSTGIMKQHGDRAGRAIIKRCLDRVAKAVAAHDGRVVDRIGDELMCAIPGAEAGILTALEIRDEVEVGANEQEYPPDLRMHIGLHYGPVVIDGEQIFGDTIHTAKRMVDLAKADQALTTLSTLEEAGGEVTGAWWRPVDEIRIKGHVEPVAIYEVMRDDSAFTVFAKVAPAPQAAETYVRCTLRFQDQTFVVDDTRPVFTIGRHAGCDLPLPVDCVSREHAKIEYQKGRFICVDRSTNGTFVSEASAAEPVLVHREERWLRDRGQLRIGSRDDPGQQVTLDYQCESAASAA